MLKDLDEGKQMVIEALHALRKDMSKREGGHLSEFISGRHKPVVHVEETHIEAEPKSLDEIPSPEHNPEGHEAVHGELREGSPEEELLESPAYEKQEEDELGHDVSPIGGKEEPIEKPKRKFGGRLY